MNASHYIGSELELFAGAHNWKARLRRELRPYLGGRVLEVGAGIGGTTAALCDGGGAWLCLEPDAGQAGRIAAKVSAGELPVVCQVCAGTLVELPATTGFDTILYIDVLEHIADDVAELQEAARRLAPGGYLVVVAPAWPWLYGPFDAAVGHHRRYTRKALAALTPPGLRVARARYLDSVGLLASLGGRLRGTAQPSHGQIALWDRVLVPLSRWVDPLIGHALGRSLLLVWRA